MPPAWPLQRRRIKLRMQQRIQLAGTDLQNSLFFCQFAFVYQVNRYFQGSRSRSLAVSGLEHIELAAFDGKFHILHISVVILQSLRDFRNCLYTSGISSASCAIGLGVLIPATTSSPWAFIRYSPNRRFSPVEGFLVNATPVPQSSPMFPNTMDCTLTAVPQLPGMSFKRRYTIARGCPRNGTRPLRPPSAALWHPAGSLRPFLFYKALYSLTTTFFRSSASSSVSIFTPFFSFAASRNRFKLDFCQCT